MHKEPTLAQGWADMLADAPPDITPGERDAGRLGFYAGAYHMLALLRASAAMQSDGDYQNTLNGVVEELDLAFGWVVTH